MTSNAAPQPAMVTTGVPAGETAYPSLLVEQLDAMRRITINRPDKMNAMDLGCQAELVEAVSSAESDPGTRVVVIRGGGPCFSAGYDLTPRPRRDDKVSGRPEVYGAVSKVNRDVESLTATVRRWSAIWHCRIPVIAQVHGHCLAGGTELAMHCDLIVVAEDAVIGVPPVRSLGVPPTHMWTYHVGPQWAKRLLLTGDTVSGTQAAEIGFALQAVPAAELDAYVLELAARISMVSRDCLVGNKYVVNQAIELMGRAHLQQTAAIQDAVAHLSPDALAFTALAREQGLKVALEHRDAPFREAPIR